MSGIFKKLSAKKSAPGLKKRSDPGKPADTDQSKAPVTRVGEGADHHDTIATTVWYVLVDDPLQPSDSVLLSDGTRPVELSTSDAVRLENLLVHLLAFEGLADKGKFTLKLSRGRSGVPTELFKDVDSRYLMGDDRALLDQYARSHSSPSGHAQPIPPTPRLLDYTLLEGRPLYKDPDLDQYATEPSVCYPDKAPHE